MENFTVSDLLQWLTSHGLLSPHAVFEEQRIDGASLVEIINDESMLKELVQKIGPRAKLRFLVKKMQQNAGELHQAYGLSPAGPHLH